MKREASRETLQRLAEAVQRRWPESNEFVAQLIGTDVGDALAAYRTETAPLRTKADVDADIVATVRRSVETHRLSDSRIWCQLCELCREETEPYGPTGAAAKESREDIAAPGGATIEPEAHPDERPCGCEDTQALQQQLSALRARNFDLGIQLSRIRRLARSLEVQGLFEEIDREP